MSDNVTSTGNTDRELIQQRGVYLMADTPPTAHPLAIEDGSGDKQLLAETVAEQLTDAEVDTLINALIAYHVNDGEEVDLDDE